MLNRPPVTAPGRLRARLDLQKPEQTPDGGGGFSTTWSAIAVVAAEISPIAGAEKRIGEGLIGTLRHRVVIRYRDDVASGDRFLLDTRVLTIFAAYDKNQDRRFLTCLVNEEGR